jgi:galactokinase
VNKLLVLEDLANRDGVLARLAHARVSSAEAPEKLEMILACRQKLLEAGRTNADRFYGFYVPGRIEVLGKHTDYAGGRSLLAATGKGFIFVACPRTDSTVRMIPADSDLEPASFELAPDITPREAHWTNYPMTVARRIARNFGGELKGADIAFASDLPPASGMSSSSALVVASFLALATVNDLSHRSEYRENIHSIEDMAEYLGCNENDLVGAKGVGTFGGSEDHTAILCGRGETLVQYSFCPVRMERSIRLPRGFVFAVAASGVIAEKTGPAMEKYNRASRLAGAVAQLWRETTGRDDPHMAAAIESSPDAPQRMRDILAKAQHPEFTSVELLARFDQFHAEAFEIIPAAGDALAAGDLEGWSQQIDRSQELTRTLLGNLVPETVYLAKTARELGAQGASAFGAGFGGAVWAMVPEGSVDGFLADWAQRYSTAFPGAAAKAGFFATHAGPAAFEL